MTWDWNINPPSVWDGSLDAEEQPEERAAIPEHFDASPVLTTGYIPSAEDTCPF